MADDETKAVVVKEGVKLYTGMGLHPFQGGETAVLPADHADELVGHGLVDHAATEAEEDAKPEPEPEKEGEAAQ